MNEENKQIAGFTPVGATGDVFHALHSGSPNCPKCGAPSSEQEVKSYDPDWHDGDVHCKKCGTYIRAYDAG